MNTELFIENINADITSDISALITFAIDDVKDFAGRSTSWSKTIILPGTAANNKLFGHIFQAGQSNYYDPAIDNINYNFNASKSAACIIFQDNIQTFKGKLRLNRIIIDKGRMEYEVAVWGDLFGLNVSLSTALLEDLDFSAYDHTWDETNIVNSWDNTPGTGYYYPLMDNGAYSNDKHNWDMATFRPALYVREYLDKMITAAGFRFTSDLFDSERFKSLIIPYNRKTLSSVNSSLLSAGRSSSITLLNSGTATSVAVQFSTIIGSTFTASLSNSRFTYTPVFSNTVNITASILGSTIANTGAYTIELRKNGILIPGQQYIIANRGNTSSQPFSWSASTIQTLNTGDYLELVSSYTSIPTGSDQLAVSIAGLGVNSFNVVEVPVLYGDTVTLNDTIPKNIKQIDFLVGIVKLFNLYVIEDKFDKNLISFTPYADFFSTDTSNAVDWTYKIDRDSPITIKPMSEITSALYNFKFKSDTDFYNDLYKKRHNQGYGDYGFDSAYEFAQQTNNLEIIFSSTVLVGYAGEEKVYSTIYKKSGTTEEQTDSNIRILQTKKISGVASWDILSPGTVTVLISKTTYGYAGHLDDPDSPSDDLNFGAPAELFFILVGGFLSDNQFNLYWSSYMAEITDKDSKLMTAKFYLKPIDIFNLDFSKYVHVDGNIFRLNKITDYNLSNPDACAVELLKVNYTIY